MLVGAKIDFLYEEQRVDDFLQILAEEEGVSLKGILVVVTKVDKCMVIGVFLLDFRYILIFFPSSGVGDPSYLGCKGIAFWELKG